MKIAILLGTRPEIIKMSPIIRECERRGLDYFIIHSNQHYDENLDKVFFDELDLPRPKYNLGVGSKAPGKQTAEIIDKTEEVLLAEKPDVIFVQGDTNTVLAGAIAGAKTKTKVGHIEAGLRSYFREMPEEINRVLADHCSDFLFPPTEKSKEILLGEKIPQEKIFVIGNTIVDAVFQNLEAAKAKEDTLEKYGVQKEEYFLLTLHRQENVNNPKRLESLLEGLKLVKEEFGHKIILPLHPSTRKKLAEFGLNPQGLEIVDPVSFLDFLQLEANAKVILTDSGGVQEEGCILKVPVVTLRDNTERLETVDVGANILVGANPKRIIEGVRKMIGSSRDWENPFGDGKASKQIIDVILR